MEGTPLFQPLLAGFFLTVALITVPGPQNLFVVRSGITKRHQFTVAISSFIADTVLILIGVLGLGFVIDQVKSIEGIMNALAVIFLVWFGRAAYEDAVREEKFELKQSQHGDNSQNDSSKRGALLCALSFSFLNPLAILDTVVIIGGTSFRFADTERTFFTLGAIAASAIWFFSLAYPLSKTVRPLFENPNGGKILNYFTSAFMIAFAFKLLL